MGPRIDDPEGAHSALPRYPNLHARALAVSSYHGNSLAKIRCSLHRHLTEYIAPTEGPASSLAAPDCASPDQQSR